MAAIIIGGIAAEVSSPSRNENSKSSSGSQYEKMMENRRADNERADGPESGPSHDIPVIAGSQAAKPMEATPAR